MPTHITAAGLSALLTELFGAPALTTDSDLAQYIKDSIDLGELLALAHERHDCTVANLALFKTHTTFGDVLKILNNEL